MPGCKHVFVFFLSIILFYPILSKVYETPEDKKEVSLSVSLGTENTKQLISENVNNTDPYCNCGPHSHNCSSIYGMIICYCDEGYAQLYDNCKECVCEQENMTCVYLGSQKRCEECDCGVYSAWCSLEDGRKNCQCSNDFAPYEGECIRCDCGEESTECKIENGKKKCTCTPGYAEYNDNSCRECSCGNSSNMICSFKGTEKKCTCKDGYTLSNGQCKKKTPGWVIAVSVIGAILFVIGLIILIIYLRRRKRSLYESR